MILNTLNDSKKYYIKVISGTNLPEITIKNAALVEAMLAFNPKYKKQILGLDGSSSKMINDCNVDTITIDILRNILKKINSEFSTRLSIKPYQRNIFELVANYIFEDIRINTFYERLSEGDSKLVLDISDFIKSISSKHAISFASKVCKCFCYWWFKDTKEADNYIIYDSVVRNALKRYLDHFGITEKYNLNDYNSYIKCFEKIRTESRLFFRQKRKISRNSMDHLLWYLLK